VTIAVLIFQSHESLWFTIWHSFRAVFCSGNGRAGKIGHTKSSSKVLPPKPCWSDFRAELPSESHANKVFCRSGTDAPRFHPEGVDSRRRDFLRHRVSNRPGIGRIQARKLSRTNCAVCFNSKWKQNQCCSRHKPKLFICAEARARVAYPNGPPTILPTRTVRRVSNQEAVCSLFHWPESVT